MDRVVSVINNRIKETGVTLTFVSNRAHIKTDLLSRTLIGKRKLKADELVNLCCVLGLTLDDFKEEKELTN